MQNKKASPYLAASLILDAFCSRILILYNQVSGIVGINPRVSWLPNIVHFIFWDHLYPLFGYELFSLAIAMQGTSSSII